MNKPLRLLLLAAFLLSACAPTQTAAPTATPAPISVEPAPSDTPFVVAQSPMEGERLLLDAAIELIFDRDMDKAATESAFELTDPNGKSVAGEISWPEARTLRFVPDARLAPASTYVAAITTDAASADGKSPLEDIRIEFRTVESPTVGQVFPADKAEDIDLDSTITVIFNRPIVPVTIAEEQGTLPQPLAITPEVAGTGEWVSSSVYVFQPQDLLGSGTRYEVRVEAGLKDSLGMPLEESFAWTFVTRAPGIDTLSLLNGETNPKMDIENVLLDQVFVITFLQPMDEKSTNAATTLVDRETFKAFPVRYKWNEDFTALTIEPVSRYRLSSFYQLDVSASALAQDGSPLKEGLTFRFSTLPPPRILSVTPKPNSTQREFDSWITIKFASPMDFDTLKSRVKVSPEPKEPLRFYYNEYEWTLNVIGLEPSTEYIVRILPGMKDIYDNSIASEYSWDFKTGEMYPNAFLVMPQPLIYRVKGDQTFFFEYTNLDSAELSLYPLTPEEFLRLQRGDIGYENFSPRGSVIRVWKPNLEVDPNERQTVEYDRKPSGRCWP